MGLLDLGFFGNIIWFFIKIIISIILSIGLVIAAIKIPELKAKLITVVVLLIVIIVIWWI